jgi:PAS domain S-box-containing protein
MTSPSQIPASRRYRTGDYELALEVLRALPIALLVVDADGTTLLANRRACAALGRAKMEMEGENVGAYLAPLDKLLSPAMHDERSAMLQVELPTAERITIGFTVEALTNLSRSADTPTYTIALKDITEVERMREERDRLLQIATVHELLPSILHEVKNPLAAIATTAELLIEEAVDDDMRDSAQAILHETRRMKLTLQGIGAVGRGLRSTRYQAVDQAIREAWTVLRPRAESVGVLARCSIPDLPLVQLDTSVVSALVFNLVTNAIQACSVGGSVELTASLTGGGASLSLVIADTGSGMTPEVLARCRELFFTTKPRGMGIGLALCDRALTDAGGQIRIESEVRVGTRITLSIPLLWPPATQPET